MNCTAFCCFSSLWLASSIIWTLPGLADEPVFCHDYAQKEAVLKEGQKYLDEHESITSGKNLRKDTGADLLFIEGNSRKHAPENPMPLTKAEIEAFPLNTREEVAVLCAQAMLRESRHEYEVAYLMYLHLLRKVRGAGKFPGALAEMLESTARAEIFVTFTPELRKEMPALSPKRNFINVIWSKLGTIEFQNTETMLQLNEIIEAISHISHEDLNTLQDVEQYYSLAYPIRKESPSFKKLAQGDLVCLAAVKDQLGKTEEAKDLYKLAYSQDPECAKYLVAYFRKHNDFTLATQYCPLIVASSAASGDYQPVSTLLDFYLINDKTDEARHIFLDAMANFVPLDSKTLIATVKILDNTDSKKVELYSARVWMNRPIDENFALEMQALDARGWGREVENIGLAQSEILSVKNKVSRLFVVAKCFCQLEKFDSALIVVKKIISRIDEEHETDSQAIKNLSQVTAMLDKEGIKQLTGTQPALAGAKQSLAYHQDRFRRQQCCVLSERLNTTATDLEKNAHYAMAEKLYKEALDIKTKNLLADDPEITMQQIDVARVIGAQQRYPEARVLYEQALARLRGDAYPNTANLISALENYGDMLNNAKLSSKAEKVYAEARTLAKANSQ